MNIRELLLEYDRAITVQKMGPSLASLGDPEHIIAQLELFDPTKNKQYVPWLVKQLVNKQFSISDQTKVHNILSNFVKIKSRLPIEQRDLGRMSFVQVDDIVDKAYNAQLSTNADKADTNNGGTFPVVPDSEVLYNGPLGQLSIPYTTEASCELGKGTEWCTSYTKSANMPNQFPRYSGMGTLYIWRDKNGQKFQFFFNDNGRDAEMKDEHNEELGNKEIMYFSTKHPIVKKVFMREASKNPRSAYYYAVDNLDGKRFPEGESTIAQSPEYAFNYAKDIIKGPWPEAEAAISKDPMYAFGYAKDVLGGKRFPEGEETIANYSMFAYYYAVDVLKGRFPAGEKAIAKNSYYEDEYKKFLDSL